MKKTYNLLLALFCLSVPIKGQVDFKTFVSDFNWNSTTEELMQIYDGHIHPVLKQGKHPTTVLMVDSIILGDYLCPVELWRKGDKVHQMTINTELMKVKSGIQEPGSVDKALKALFPQQENYSYIDPHAMELFHTDPTAFTKWFSKEYSVRLKTYWCDPTVIAVQHLHYSPYDFRNAHWGDVVDSVLIKEKQNFKQLKHMSYYDIYTSKDIFEGMPCLVGYHFKKRRFEKSKLVKGKYLITKELKSTEEYIDHFYQLVQIMRDRYGNEETISNSLEPINKVYQWENYNSFIYVSLINKGSKRRKKLCLEVTYSDKATEKDYNRRLGRRVDPKSPFTRY